MATISTFLTRKATPFRVPNYGRIGIALSLIAGTIAAFIAGAIALHFFPIDYTAVGIAGFAGFMLAALGVDALFWKVFPTRSEKQYISALIRSHGPGLLERVLDESRRTTRWIGTRYKLTITDPAFRDGRPKITAPQLMFAIQSGRFDATETAVLNCMLMFIGSIGQQVGHQVVPSGRRITHVAYYAIRSEHLVACSL